MTPIPTAGNHLPEPGRTAIRPASPATTPLPTPTGMLSALLGSEDTLFRDPFAEFAPSGR